MTDVETAKSAIRGEISWNEARRRLKTSKHGTFYRICALLRHEHTNGNN